MTDLLKQIRVAIVGMPDAGKSTLIKNILEQAIGKHLSPDTLMDEVHWSDGKDPYGNPDTRTIKCAKILFKYKDIEFCLYDCPGHYEYMDQIGQGILGAHCIVKIIDTKRYAESLLYFEKIDTLNKITYNMFSHSDENEYPRYDVELSGFKIIAKQLLDNLYDRFKDEAIDIEQEALDIIKDTMDLSVKNAMFFSAGKDSLVGLDLYRQAGLLNDIEVLFPYSGFDFKEVEEMIGYYENYYGITINRFDNSLGDTYDTKSSFEMLQNKAKANNDIIEKNHYDLVSVQYRASDEGVRSKDYHISDKGNHVRFSPVFYFSETNIWRYISKHNLKVCDLYYKGYRSLGDEPITLPCMPKFNNVDEIVCWIDNNPGTTERDGRKKQDNAEKYTMERLRNGGFF